MEWGKLFASLPDEPRVQAADDTELGAFGLLVQSMCYCTSAESDGFIPSTQVPRFGGAKLKARVAALACEGLWIAAERDGRDGYLLDPDIWNEDRNLNDSAERKKKADRERIAAKRATARASQNGHASRDSRASRRATEDATGSATDDDSFGQGKAKTAPLLAGIPTSNGDIGPPLETCGKPPDQPKLSSVPENVARQSHTEKRREEKNPPLPPRKTAAVSTPPLLNLAATGEGGDQSIRNQDRDALAAEVRALRPDWSTASIRRALAAESVAERPWPLARSAMLAVATDPASDQPGRLAHDGPWWRQNPAASARAPLPDCDRCGNRRRLEDPVTRDDAGRCPDCNPSTARESA